MRHQIVILIFVSLLISCSKESKEDTFQIQIDEFFTKNLKDPKSYELIKKTIDSVRGQEIMLDKTIYDSRFNWKRNRENPKIITKLELIKMYDSVMAIVYKIKYRAKNSFGGYGLENQSFVFSKNGFLIDNCRDVIDCNQKIYDYYLKEEFNKLIDNPKSK